MSKEDLHPDLQPFLEYSDCFGFCLKHPLVFSVPYSPSLNHDLNKVYGWKWAEVRKSRAEGRWSSYVFLYERPYRFEAFYSIASKLSDGEYWKLVREIWVDSENLYQSQPEVVFSRKGAWRMMEPQEREALKAMVYPLRVWRGCMGHNEAGWSWTLDRDRAQWFANRFGRKGRVIEARASKGQVVAYIQARGEEEIIIDPQGLRYERSDHDRGTTASI